MTRAPALSRGSLASPPGTPTVAAYRPGCLITKSRIARAIAPSASEPARPWIASRTASPSSFNASTAIRWLRSARLSTCLYSDGVRTPSRSATRPMLSAPKPTSSATAAAHATTLAVSRPALGTLGLRDAAQERQDQRAGLVRVLRVRVVAGALDDLQLGVRHRGHDRL